jgi:hypothetical protein
MPSHNRRNGNHSDAMIKDFGALLHNVQDPTNQVPLYSGTREFIKHRSCKK